MMAVWALVFLVTVANADIDYSRNRAVQLFQEYIQIDTTVDGDLSEGLKFWQRLAAEENVQISIYEYVEGKPVIIMKLPGTNPHLSSIMLNSHMDVVPALESDGWTYPPFSGYLTEDGEIWGRGTQDMKSVSIQYFEALKRIKDNNITLLRDVYMTLIPDEETGSYGGMAPFLESDEFAAMNVGFELDEGTAYNLPYYAVFYQDKVAWNLQVTCIGTPAHGSSLPATNETAVGKCNNVMNLLFDYRDKQYEIAQSGSLFDNGGYTSINLNRIWGGTANNVIMNSVTMIFNIRPQISINEATFKRQMTDIVLSVSDNIAVEFIDFEEQSPATVMDSSNPYWKGFQSVASSLGIFLVPVIPTGSTDARYLRRHGIPAFGFSPMPNTEMLLHAVDERLNAKVFLDGIDIYEKLISAFANLSESEVGTDPSAYIIHTVA